MGTHDQRRVRLSINIQPELQRQVKLAAAARHLSVREYVETVLRRELSAAAAPVYEADDLDQSDPTIPERLTPAEQERGLYVLREIERIRSALAAKHDKCTPESWELLNAARDERTRDLSQAVEE